MKYKPRPGIALVRICNSQILAPTRAVNEYCSTFHQLSLMEILIWYGLENDHSMDLICEVCAVFKREPKEELVAFVEGIMREMYEMGYLIEIPDGEASDDPD